MFFLSKQQDAINTSGMNKISLKSWIHFYNTLGLINNVMKHNQIIKEISD